MTTHQFSVHDVTALARAIIDHSEEVDDGGKTAYARCKYCRKASPMSWQQSFEAAWDKIQHSHDCPYLIAGDVLT